MMKVNSIKQESSDIRNEACAWLSQIETGDMKLADNEAFREWIQRSPKHMHEMQRLSRVSLNINMLTDMVAPLNQAAKQYVPASPRANRKWSSPGTVFTGMALAVLTLAIGFQLQRSPAVIVSKAPEVIATQIGEYREEALPDGSTIALNTDSKVEIDFSDERRDVRLLKGEVLFTVEHDPARPFMVTAGNKTVQAVGTAFLVRHDPARFEVTVTEGKVRLQQTAAEQAQRVTGQQSSQSPESEEPEPRVVNSRIAVPQDGLVLRAGERFAQVGGEESQSEFTITTIEAVSESDLKRQLAWQEGLLEFSDTSLSQVVAEVSRHTNLKIEIPDPALRDLKFGGIYRIGDTQPLFKALHAAYNINVVYIREDTVQLTRGDG